MARRIFVLALTPDKQIEVNAISISHVVGACTAALPHLGVAECARPRSIAVNEQHRYTLSCLLCDLVNPQHPHHPPFVAMQEHLWAEHGLSYEEQALAASVFDGTREAGCYVWWTPTHGAYFRAFRHASRAENFPMHRVFSAQQIPMSVRQEGRLTLSSLRASAVAVDVSLAGADEHAWYGHYANENEERLLLFPRSWWAVVSGTSFVPRTERELQLLAEIEAYHQTLARMVYEIWSLMPQAGSVQPEDKEKLDLYANVPGFFPAIMALAMHPELPVNGTIDRFLRHFCGTIWSLGALPPSPQIILARLKQETEEPRDAD